MACCGIRGCAVMCMCMQPVLRKAQANPESAWSMQPHHTMADNTSPWSAPQHLATTGVQHERCCHKIAPKSGWTDTMAERSASAPKHPALSRRKQDSCVHPPGPPCATTRRVARDCPLGAAAAVPRPTGNAEAAPVRSAPALLPRAPPSMLLPLLERARDAEVARAGGCALPPTA